MLAKLPRLSVQIVQGKIIKRVAGQHATGNARGSGRDLRCLRNLWSDFDERVSPNLARVLGDSLRPVNDGAGWSLRDCIRRRRRRCAEHPGRRSQLRASTLAVGAIAIIPGSISRRPGLIGRRRRRWIDGHAIRPSRGAIAHLVGPNRRGRRVRTRNRSLGRRWEFRRARRIGRVFCSEILTDLDEDLGIGRRREGRARQ